MPMRIAYDPRFEREFERIRDPVLKERIIKQIYKLEYHHGKPLRYGMKGLWSMRVAPFRIVYKIEGDLITIVEFDHRDQIYK
jgi:mRNA-degrading endonuclease RelE of RelBE toxin-antitoxin system